MWRGILKKKKYAVYVIPHFHFDVAWIRTYEEYLKFAFSNVLDVLKLTGEHDEYRFCLDQVVLIQAFLERYPEEAEALQKAIADGKLELVCGMYTMADANIPSGEFLVRQFVLGKRFMKKNFGVDVQCGWMIDSFGHSLQMPQILKKCGFKYYVFGRGAPQGVPTEFYWKGIDGTKILTHWMARTYVAGWIPPSGGECLQEIGKELPSVTSGLLYSQSLRWLPISPKKGVEKLDEVFDFLVRLASTRNVLIPNGGDFSPPQPGILSVIEEWNREREDVKAVLSTPSSFFRSVEASIEKLPEVTEDLNPVFQGVYGSRIGIKQKNREAENDLLTAERFATVASILGAYYPQDRLEEATRLLLFNQFHDIICGCGVDKVNENAIQRFEESKRASEGVLKASLHHLTHRIDTRGKGVPVIVFNPLSWARTDIVIVEVSFVSPGARAPSIKDHTGKNVPFQLISEEHYPDNTLKLVTFSFLAQAVPAMGYKTYFVHANDEPLKQESIFKTGSDCIENQFFKVTIDRLHGGNIVSLYDEQNRREILDTAEYLGNCLISETDVGDLYEANGSADGLASMNTLKIEQLPDSEATDLSSDHTATVSIQTGPVMSKISVTGHMEDLVYQQEIILYDGMRRIDFRTKVDFNGDHKRVRVCLPFNVKDGKIYHEIPFGVIQRGEGEYPAQNWIDYSNKEYGVSLINRGLPGNNITKGVAFITLLRSVDRVFTGQPAGEDALERGEHEFNYAILPHKGGWKQANSHKAALHFNIPLIVMKTTIHKGPLPKELSFLSIDPETLVLTAMKRSNEDLILRFYETTGDATKGRITLFKQMEEAWITNLLETNTQEVRVDGTKIPVEIRPFEIRTLRIKTEKLTNDKDITVRQD